MEAKLSKSCIKRVLNNRFINDRCKALSLIPKPNLLKDIKKATKRIKQAIQNREKIAIVGDYDVDGVVASVIISEFFDDIGVHTQVKIPNRFVDGYGLKKEIVHKLGNVDLIITVDNGISAHEAADFCFEAGIDLIITDHHNVPNELPKAYAIVNPKQDGCNFPNSEICGAQVAWYLVAALKDELNIKYNLSKFLDLLSIAIVADMMELKDINRVMVKAGLKYLNSSNRVAFDVIKTFFRKSHFKCEDISYLIAPLINSSGRMEDAIYSYEFLKAKTQKEAYKILEYIVDLNTQRKEMESNLFEKSLKLIDPNSKVIVVWGDDWHEGVLGIVASRLARRFNLPTIVFSINGDIAKGSARSVGSIDILKFIEEQKDLLLGYGGHKGAAGISLESCYLQQFKDNLEQSFAMVSKDQYIQKSEILGEINPKEIDFELLDILEEYEPYGQQNPLPIFTIKDAYVKNCKIIGQNGNHQKMLLECDDTILESICFNFVREVDIGKKVNIIFSISKNEFRGVITPQLVVKEVQIS